MSRKPQNENLSQAALFHLGEKRKGREYADIMPDHMVRREGVKHIGKKIAALGLATAATVGALDYVGHAVDRSPTFQQYREQHSEHEVSVPVAQVENQPIKIDVHNSPASNHNTSE